MVCTIHPFIDETASSEDKASIISETRWKNIKKMATYTILNAP